MLPVIGDVPESAVFSAGFPSSEELFPLAGAFPLESTDEVLPSVSGGGVFSCTFLGAPLVDLGAPFVEFGASHSFSYCYRVEELLGTLAICLYSFALFDGPETNGGVICFLTPDRRLCITSSFCRIWVRMVLAATLK